MVKTDALVNAVTDYVSKMWSKEEWQHFGRETGTSDILSSHPRLYRSLGFGDDDYPEAARAVLLLVLRDAVDPSAGPSVQLELLAEFMPGLPSWVDKNGAYRTKKLFNEYLAGLRPDDIPVEWRDSGSDSVSSGSLADDVDDSDPFKDAIDWYRESTKPEPIAKSKPALKPIAPPEMKTEESPSPKANKSEKRIFIVHGHDHVAVRDVQVYVHKATGIMPVVLADLPGGGDTIIEKFEKNAAAAHFAIVLLTPDDEGRVKDPSKPLQDRARQNVVLELGYFFGKLGRKQVAVLDAGVEQPSDVHGLSYIAYPSGNWKDELRDELGLAGLTK